VRWTCTPAASRISWRAAAPEFHWLGFAWRGGAAAGGERRAHAPRSGSMSSPLLGRRRLVGAPAPGCEQRSAPAGSMGESSCCTADELVLVPPGSALARVGLARVRYTPGGTSSPRAAIGL